MSKQMKRSTVIGLLMLLYDSKCFYCGTTCIKGTHEHNIKNKSFPKNLATIDHLHPVGQGGRDVSDNLVLCCYECNQHKSKFENPEDKVNYRKYDGVWFLGRWKKFLFWKWEILIRRTYESSKVSNKRRQN